tara:strand:- start:3385 stop:3765 length:381 start_codon:yes stop_codon:yes gene_type:complete
MNLEQSLRKVFDVGYSADVDETSFLAEQIYGMNVELEDDVATVCLYAHTQKKIPAVQRDLSIMQDRFVGLLNVGYCGNGIELVHEDQTTDRKEYRISVPVTDQDQLDSLVYAVATLDQRNSNDINR